MCPQLRGNEIGVTTGFAVSKQTQSQHILLTSVRLRSSVTHLNESVSSRKSSQRPAPAENISDELQKVMNKLAVSRGDEQNNNKKVSIAVYLGQTEALPEWMLTFVSVLWFARSLPRHWFSRSLPRSRPRTQSPDRKSVV